MAPGYCRCEWQDWCFEHNKDCHACWQAWNDGRAWAERMRESSYEEKLNRLEAELILSEAARDAQAAAASAAVEMRAEKKAAKKAAKKSKAVKKEKAAKKSRVGAHAISRRYW
jgi:hypothetical protein